MITLADIKQQCRIDDDDNTEDALLSRYLKAAEIAVANHLDRAIFWSAADKGGNDGIVIDGCLETAMLMLIGHFYEHREAVADIQLHECPVGYDLLLQPCRNMGV